MSCECPNIEGRTTAPLKCRRLYPDAQLPRLSGVCVDVHAYLKSERGHPIKLALASGLVRSVKTGLHVSCDHTLMLSTPLSLATRTISVVNTFAASGELLVWLHNSGSHVEWIEHGDCVARATLVKFPIPLITEETSTRPPMQVRRCD